MRSQARISCGNFQPLFRLLCGLRPLRTAKLVPSRVSRGVSPLAYWGIFSVPKECGSEKALISYGYFQISFRGAAVRLSAAFFVTDLSEYRRFCYFNG